MATSGKLAEDLSVVLDLSRASIQTSMQALRQAGLIASKGRGLSAAQMSTEDASTVLIAIGSSASVPHVVRVTELLKQMPLRATASLDETGSLHKTDDPLPEGFEPLFFDAMIILLQAASSLGYEEEPTDAVYDPMENPESFGVWIGTDGQKQGGFAMVRAKGRTGPALRNLYSTWPLKPGAAEAPFELLTIFETESRFFSIAYFSGEVLAAVVRSLREPVDKPRKRDPKAARFSRG